MTVIGLFPLSVCIEKLRPSQRLDVVRGWWGWETKKGMGPGKWFKMVTTKANQGRLRIIPIFRIYLMETTQLNIKRLQKEQTSFAPTSLPSDHDEEALGSEYTSLLPQPGEKCPQWPFYQLGCLKTRKESKSKKGWKAQGSYYTSLSWKLLWSTAQSETSDFLVIKSFLFVL